MKERKKTKPMKTPITRIQFTRCFLLLSVVECFKVVFGAVDGSFFYRIPSNEMEFTQLQSYRSRCDTKTLFSLLFFVPSSHLTIMQAEVKHAVLTVIRKVMLFCFIFLCGKSRHWINLPTIPSMGCTLYIQSKWIKKN